MLDMEVSQKESEVQNATDLFKEEKVELEAEQRDSYLREIQSKQIDLEDRKKQLANNELELRKQQRQLEKKQELISTDREQLEANL